MDKPKVRSVHKVSRGQTLRAPAVRPAQGNDLLQSSRVRVWCTSGQRDDYGRRQCAQSDLEYASQLSQWMILHRRIEPDHDEYAIRFK